MSSEVHGDAEETIRYFVGKMQEPHVFEQMALQTVLTARLYVYYAVSCFVRASLAYAERYGMLDAKQPLRDQMATVQEELMQIALLLESDDIARDAG